MLSALAWWRDHYRAKAKHGEPFFIRPDRSRFRVDALCKRYREQHLAEAGITRADLFPKRGNKTRIGIRVHDLRAAFVTYSVASGRTEAWVADRTGHRSSQMIARYRRRARTVARVGHRNLAPMDHRDPRGQGREAKQTCKRICKRQP